METAQWQPIETAPKDGTRILVCEEDGDITLVSWGYVDYENQWVVPWGDDVLKTSFYGGEPYYATVENPTHWMPLPEPPVN